jgi:hypothetical protein
MHVVYHLGAHCTDDDKLVRSLLKNRGQLAPRGVVVPGPGRYRPVLREALRTLRGAPASREMQETLMDAIIDEDGAERLIMSSESFLCAPARAVDGGVLYRMAAEKSPWFANVFPDDSCEFFLAIRNPAAFLPALTARLNAEDSAAILAATDPATLRWSGVVTALRDANPECEVTIWCDEDSPLIWPEILCAITGMPEGTAFDGADDRLRELLTEAGADTMAQYLAANPPPNVALRRRAQAAFMETFADAEALEQELDLPGWTDATIERLTDAYEADCALIHTLPGIRFLEP